MMRNPCDRIVQRLHKDSAFLARYEDDAEQTLDQYGYRLSEDEMIQLSERLIQEVIDGRRSTVTLVCPCRGAP